MRAPLAAAVVLWLAATAHASASATPATALRIAFFEDGARASTRVVWTLRCDPAAGTHPRRALACRELARSGARTLLPVPGDVACTEIYGGPQVAIVSGTIDGRRVWVRLRRDNGCEIARWERNRFLVPAGGVR